MTKLLFAAAFLAGSCACAHAGGIDRSGQSVALLFQEGNLAEFGISRTFPSVGGSGVGIAPILAPGSSFSDVARAFSTVSGGAKWQINPDLSAAIIVDNPYGADVGYNGGQFTTELGGTTAFAHATAITALLRYKFNDSWSVHGGLRVQQAGGEINLKGLAYGLPEAQAFGLGRGTVNGYRVQLEDDIALGWVAGIAYEIPDIALRVALTYFSEIEHSFDTVESGPSIGVDVDGDPTTPNVLLPVLDGASQTKVKLPQAINLDFQTGIAPDTLLFGQLRWVEWSAFRIDPRQFVAVVPNGLINLKDSRTWTLGLARKFNETWAGSVSLIYDEPTKKLSSPLSPSNGYNAIALGGSYAVNQSTTVSAGVRYTWIGNSRPETGTPDVARANFRDNTATSFGLKVGFKF